MHEVERHLAIQGQEVIAEDAFGVHTVNNQYRVTPRRQVTTLDGCINSPPHLQRRAINSHRCRCRVHEGSERFAPYRRAAAGDERDVTASVSKPRDADAVDGAPDQRSRPSHPRRGYYSGDRGAAAHILLGPLPFPDRRSAGRWYGQSERQWESSPQLKQPSSLRRLGVRRLLDERDERL